MKSAGCRLPQQHCFQALVYLSVSKIDQGLFQSQLIENWDTFHVFFLSFPCEKSLPCELCLWDSIVERLCDLSKTLFNSCVLVYACSNSSLWFLSRFGPCKDARSSQLFWTAYDCFLSHVCMFWCHVRVLVLSCVVRLCQGHRYRECVMVFADYVINCARPFFLSRLT